MKTSDLSSPPPQPIKAKFLLSQFMMKVGFLTTRYLVVENQDFRLEGAGLRLLLVGRSILIPTDPCGFLLAEDLENDLL
jgi:hypothetical protein